MRTRYPSKRTLIAGILSVAIGGCGGGAGTDDAGAGAGAGGSTSLVGGSGGVTAGGGTGGSGDSGGTIGAGGSRSGGTTGSGGVIGSGGSGGQTSTGGRTGSGGTSATGGTTGSGGQIETGGTTGTAGATGSGGTTASGGTTGAGGRTGAGGTSASGGATGRDAGRDLPAGSGGVVTGGGSGTGGVGGVSGAGGAATGGSTSTSTGTVDCNAAMPSGGTQHTGSTQGGSGNLTWSLWENGSGGSITTFTTTAFSAAWGPNSGDFLARIGLEWGNAGKTYDQYGTITALFTETKSGSGGGYSYLGIYGWSNNPCIEWYIVDDSYNKMPVNPGNTTNKGTATIDGGTYTLYSRPTSGTGGSRCSGVSSWTQFYSVRQTARTCGQITISDHFKAWAAAGMTLGNLLEAKILVEVGGGTGSINFPVANVSTSQ